MSGVEEGKNLALTPGELDRVEKAIFEVARQQRGKLVPVPLPFPDYWSRVVELIINLEQEVDDMRREGVGSARLSTGTRRLSNIRTQLRNLANLRLSALTSDAVLDSLLGRKKDGSINTGGSIDWSKMDVNERVFHTEVSNAVDKFRRVSSWNLLMGVEEVVGEQSVGVPELVDFDRADSGDLAPMPGPTATIPVDWDDPDMDEEDRIRAIDAGYHEAPPAPTPVAPKANSVRVRIIQNSDDPVIDEEGREVRIITLEDIIDVIDEEAEEDLMALAGVSDASIRTSVLETFQGRAPWLFVNLITAVIASVVIGFFESTIEKVVALAVLMPIVASMGGNAGTQTVTVAVRAIAMREFSPKVAVTFGLRELYVGIANGLIFAVVTAGLSYIWFGDAQIALVLGIAMIVNMVVAAISGTLIPLSLVKVGVDPAIASSVFITTITDVIGFLVFLGLAALYLL